jgi:putative hydrolase of the HAD superfamily
MAANQAFVDYCQARIPGFPDCAGVNEYMNAVREERAEISAKKNERHYPLSFASLRIAGGFRAAIDCGFPEADAVGVVARGYHIAWIPARGMAAKEHMFPGVRESLQRLRANHPHAIIGSITNGLGSARGAGLGAYFDFEVSADQALDEEVNLHGDDARKPGTFPHAMALRRIRELRGLVDGENAEAHEIDPRSWVHVGDDLVNDCQFAKRFGAKAVRVIVPGVEPYVPGGGVRSFTGDPGRNEIELDIEALVDATVASVEELPELFRSWEAGGTL